MTRDWDAQTYDRVADPQTRWGTAVLERLPLDGDERVLDAGCGSGRVTELLANRLPDGRVVALDGSPSMIDAARERLAPFGDRIEYVVADLGQPLPIDGTVDAILSTATFHWVPDHDALFKNLAAVLRPGGWLVAQCGGYGNIESVKRALATIGDGWLGPAHYETPMATVRRLDAAGFVDIECWLTDEPTRFEPGEPLETFMRTVILAPNLERVPPEEHAAFVHEVASRLPGAADRLRPAQYRGATLQPLTLRVGRGTMVRGPGSRRRRPPGRAPDRARSQPGRPRAGRSRASGPRATTGGSSRRRHRRR